MFGFMMYCIAIGLATGTAIGTCELIESVRFRSYFKKIRHSSVQPTPQCDDPVMFDDPLAEEFRRLEEQVKRREEKPIIAVEILPLLTKPSRSRLGYDIPIIRTCRHTKVRDVFDARQTAHVIMCFDCNTVLNTIQCSGDPSCCGGR
jgi:hypothetical protein